MSDYYTYEDDLHWTFRITPINDGGYAHVLTADENSRGVGIAIPADERQAAAQALAGDEYRVVSAKQAGKSGYPHWDGDFRILGPGVFADADLNVVNVNGENYTRQANPGEPIDPSDVRVGDVVEVEADDGSWMVRGKVDDRTATRLRFDLPTQIAVWFDLTDATVRLVRRAESDPDTVQVEALHQLIEDIWGETTPDLARELVRRGVTVGGERR